MILTLARCWSAKEGEDEAEGGGGDMLPGGEPGDKLKDWLAKTSKQINKQTLRYIGFLPVGRGQGHAARFSLGSYSSKYGRFFQK